MDYEALGDGVLDTIEAKVATANGFAVLTPIERTMYFPSLARGKIGNGGFEYFYADAEPPMADVVRGFRTLGFAAAAAACEKSMRLFPGGRPPGDIHAMTAATAKIDFSVLENDEHAVMDIQYAQLRTAVGRYYDAHRAEFPFSLK